MSYAEMENAMLLKTLEHFSGDKRAAADALGVSTRTIHNQLARMKQPATLPSDGEAMRR